VFNNNCGFNNVLSMTKEKLLLKIMQTKIFQYINKNELENLRPFIPKYVNIIEINTVPFKAEKLVRGYVFEDSIIKFNFYLNSNLEIVEYFITDKGNEKIIFENEYEKGIFVLNWLNSL
jgi:hypothetical protein